MKTLKIRSTILTILAVLLSFTACKKDDNGAGGGGSNSGSYKFSGTDYPISAALEKHIDGDIFLEFDSGNTGNYLQINLPKTASLPLGVLSYNPDRFAQGYDPLKNFWSTGVGIGGVNTNATGGTINISKNDSGGYKITFNITTAKGTITSEYNGTPTKS
jgi:hypothetical protein